MKKKWSRKAALLLAAVTILTSLPTEYLYAAQTQETQDTVTPEEQSNEETVIDTALTGQESITDTEQETTEAVEGTTATEETADGTETAGKSEIETQSADTQNAVTADILAAEDLLNYLVLDNAYIAVGGTQNVVANIGNEDLAIGGGRLLYHRVSDGAAYEMAATETDGNGLRFSETFADESRTGEYALDAIIYEKDAQEYQINLSDAGMDVRFGVNTEVETNPDAEVVDEATTDVDMDVVSFDENGNQTSEDSIADAIATQKAEAAESGISTARYNGNVVVVLDPGHDGTHGGSSANGFVEAQLNLKIAQYCKAELEEYYGVTVYMTRDSASCPNGGGDNKSCLQRRADIARDMGANLFVSLHNNYSSASSASGAEIWYPNQNYNPWTSQVGGSAASCILEQLTSLGLKGRGTQIRNANEDKYPDGSAADYYAVIRHCKEYGIPGIIVEHAFMSNSSDAANFLSNDEGLKKLGVADATGIAQYFGLKKEKPEEYSAVFDAAYYADRYPDLKTAFGNDDSALLQHFIQYGMAEGRQGSSQFDVYSYKNLYPDLRAAFGNNLKSYYMHYISSGKSEGRKATGVNTLQKPITTYNGIDYSAVYDYNYYLKKHSDLAKIYTNDDIGLLAHFVNCGMSEGRQAKDSFDVFSYRNQYQDLRVAFGNNLKSYYMHYISNGKAEGRKATGVKSIQNPITTYNGVDYSAVYDYNFYIKKYSDLARIYTNDEVGLLAHFVNCGMAEGRQAKADFDVFSYRNQYQDLRLAFGKDLKSYYFHYMNSGKKERRTAAGVKVLQNPVTIYNGTDYSAVYDYNYYNSKYSDLKSAFKGDDIDLLAHFVNNGMKEGRQASKKFNVQIYKNNYMDLQQAFGNDLKPYYMHYIQNGKAEGRNAESQIYHSVITKSTTTVNQMVNYYNAKASYPAYYGNANVPDIRSFCQVYYDEATAEGVDPALAFTQAMKETGFLKFTGQVKIDQFNFAGMGVTDASTNGDSYQNVREGIRAHVQHLKAYAVKNPTFANPVVDKRYSSWFAANRSGTAPYIEWLGISENPSGFGWATEKGYGYSILNDYMNQLYKY
ncbi:N-acetylmuramoyl-L-alanine amidase [Roseburia amylophila]|jgi:N-acetylmuramoyl-L-alanine amidase|uniref:N-acetylmuramoyl-L-alanine amidase n=1 Tax=Roseburia amylophila TaxID=2981794 RepID=A0ABT2SBH3_9FIRM|nr:N-acetylmuramoyl-L-alanine amidase [Roseburia amylophila]MCU6716068.1 N-acetylmuramoyl-L-alanine amidase [Roseburia amylophila]SCH16767.1 Sporulation-specific N-acetylmuramoyl-L-alanine amidase [uncultured Roseburia sp.]